MASSPDKPAGLETKWIRLRNKRSERRITHHHPICIAAHFGSRSAILKVIFSIVFGHPGSLDESIQKGIVHVFPESLPAITPTLQQIHFLTGGFGLKGLAIELNSIKRITITAAIVHVKPAVVVSKKSRVPATDLKGIN